MDIIKKHFSNHQSIDHLYLTLNGRGGEFVSMLRSFALGVVANVTVGKGGGWKVGKYAATYFVNAGCLFP